MLMLITNPKQFGTVRRVLGQLKIPQRIGGAAGRLSIEHHWYRHTVSRYGWLAPAH